MVCAWRHSLPVNNNKPMLAVGFRDFGRDCPAICMFSRMVKWCCTFSCSNKEGRDDVSFYRIPLQTRKRKGGAWRGSKSAEIVGKCRQESQQLVLLRRLGSPRNMTDCVVHILYQESFVLSYLQDTLNLLVYKLQDMARVRAYQFIIRHYSANTHAQMYV